MELSFKGQSYMVPEAPGPGLKKPSPGYLGDLSVAKKEKGTSGLKTSILIFMQMFL